MYVINIGNLCKYHESMLKKSYIMIMIYDNNPGGRMSVGAESNVKYGTLKKAC